MSETHILKLPKRTCRLQIVEEPARIVVKLHLDKYGDFGDLPTIDRWMATIIGKYDADKRPLYMENPHTNQTVTIYGDANSSVAIHGRRKG